MWLILKLSELSMLPSSFQSFVTRRSLPGVFAVVALLALSGQSLAATGCQDLSGTPIRPAVSWQGDIKPIFNELISPTGRCTSCHSGKGAAAGLDLSDEGGFDAIYKIVIGEIVVPGYPLGSRLFNKVNCSEPDSGSQMPLAGALLSTEEREKLYDWIEQGAYGEDPESADGAIYRDFMFRDGAESIRFMRQ
jgi:hypothetical protein